MASANGSGELVVFNTDDDQKQDISQAEVNEFWNSMNMAKEYGIEFFSRFFVADQDDDGLVLVNPQSSWDEAN